MYSFVCREEGVFLVCQGGVWEDRGCKTSWGQATSILPLGCTKRTPAVIRCRAEMDKDIFYLAQGILSRFHKTDFSACPTRKMASRLDSAQKATFLKKTSDSATLLQVYFELLVMFTCIFPLFALSKRAAGRCGCS